MAVKNSLRIVKAQENNLKAIDLELPHDCFLGITGLSGSGKSSLAFDTIYAEGQRRYIETFSPYTRQFFDKVKRPKVDLIDNVRPAIAIQQRTRILNSRSTVGSMTDINDFLKIIWSNLATPVCPRCSMPLKRWDGESLTEALSRWCTLKDGSTFLIGVVTANKADNINRLQTLGYSRYLNPVNAELTLFEDSPPRKKDKQVFVVIDRCRAGNFNSTRIKDSIEQSFSIGDGVVSVAELRTSRLKPLVRLSAYNEPLVAHALYESYSFSREFQCGDATHTIARPRPALFSYNHPIGACSECNGFGKVLVIDPHRCVPDHSKSIAEYAVECWKGNAASGEHRQLLAFCKRHSIPIDKPWHKLSDSQKDDIFNHKSREFIGINPWFSWLERKKYKMHVRVFLARYRGQVDCPSCKGTRFKSDALSYRIKGLSIAQVSALPLGQLYTWFTSLRDDSRASGGLPRELDEIFASIIKRLYYLVTLGLPYLTLDRQSRTLSGGETQRVNLVSALGSNLISTHFVLDEPSVGLHARDTRALVGALRDLTARGNSLTVVEHDPECLHESDYVLELGPEAGERGGDVTFFGPEAAWQGVGLSPFEPNSKPPVSKNLLQIEGATVRNLDNLSVTIPLNAFVCLTGVSGSGKSTLLTEIIQAGYQQHLGAIPGEGAVPATISGYQALSDVLLVDQSPLSKTPRANIATYTKIWNRVRDILAATDQAVERGLSRSSFSFNVAGGRCPACEGAGFIREDMQFLSDVFMECETCLGTRFQAPVLEARYKDHNVHQLLSMSVDACAELFLDEPQITQACRVLKQLGLGHITLGHPLSELSGGEAQRLKLVPHILDGVRGRSLFLFDEPTTGLHMRDVERLIELFYFLRSQGHSIICVEHNLRLIASADWVIDLGPEGGAGGGQIVEQGTPADLIKRAGSKGGSNSLTANFLAESIRSVKRGGRERRAANSDLREPSPQRDRSAIQIRGAKEHNLKDISLDLPLGSLITITGVSGSGKSTIAKDIIYAEGQRRYLDCLSPYARQFIKELKKPAIDDIVNIQPTICVYQHTFQPSALSTVATMSEVYNFLRLLYAKVGTQYCPDHPEQSVSPLSAEQIASFIKENYQGSVRLLAPVITLKKGNHRAVFQRALETEIMEVRVDGVFSAPGRFVEQGLTKTKAHSIEFVTARCTVKNMKLDLLTDGVRQALSIGGGTVIVSDSSGERVFSSQRTCQVCQRGFFKPDPEDLSFNSKRGRCPRCDGYGAIKGKPCPACSGSRLNEIGRNIKLFGRGIHQLCAVTAPELLDLLKPLTNQSTIKEIAEPILKELTGKLTTLSTLGLDHLALSRECATLSNGELQRLRLGTAMGSPLSGVTYIFDEPSAGLHPADNKRLLGKLRDLKERGNTVIQIEHEIDNILASEHIIDIGPGAGTRGGEVVFQGEVNAIRSNPQSATALALTNPLEIKRKNALKSAPQMRILSGSKNNISKLSCDIPLQSLVAISGVSGAGKSSLINGIIVETLSGKANSKNTFTSKHGQLELDVPIDRLLVVDQQPIGKTSRSTPASYLGIWDEVRTVFSSTLEAKSRGWGASFFSHNTGKGRCPVCKGQGELTLEMSFLAEAKVPCESCEGSRFTFEADTIRYKDLSISQILKLTFEEARTIFVNHRKIHQACAIACELGLGYLALGQPSSTLSGGESQRLKLVSELRLSRKGHTLYILDEPTTGLHRLDVALLLRALHALVDQGHSVFVIEHDADTIAQSDWVLELGPGPGAAGGEIVFEGRPSELLKAKTAWGACLRERQALHSQSASSSKILQGAARSSGA